MIFSTPTRRAPALRPGGERLPLLQRNKGVLFCFHHPELSLAGEKGCLPVTRAVRFAARFRFFVFFAQETVGIALFPRSVLQ